MCERAFAVESAGFLRREGVIGGLWGRGSYRAHERRLRGCPARIVPSGLASRQTCRNEAHKCYRAQNYSRKRSHLPCLHRRSQPPLAPPRHNGRDRNPHKIQPDHRRHEDEHGHGVGSGRHDGGDDRDDQNGIAEILPQKSRRDDAEKRQKENQNRQFKNRSEEHTSELQSRENLVCRLLLEKKKKKKKKNHKKKKKKKKIIKNIKKI